ncbi:MAG TPA: aminotransferase class IV [Terriglobia bacterium]|nr:aminotransferase class IV [Terriglobia bacterium]
MDFRLIETMRVSDSGEVPLLERHLQRLRQSARHFSFKFDSEKLREAINGAMPRGPASMRLLLSQNGDLEISSGTLPSGHPDRLELSTVRVNSKDQFLYHKTTNRTVYEQARIGHDENTDVILINERGELTETTITNIAVYRDGAWITPALSCGLLPGVQRAELLARGDIVEGIIHPEDLSSSDPVRCFNALRGVFEAALSPRERAPRSGG